ncbi:aldolase [Polynucleobacter antarcticus]|uniref:Aldolase n=1 Tax=Polynucleobacter antarcticus TaxID=1743162 RepID=A0A6M9PXA2_9BURK|nr:aldolase [Polynucleobacter antarcticus]QKM63587.1 aldolase [Polynucleobacter antarcticus]
MIEQLAREEICRVGKSLFDRSYVHATAGNISVRIKDGFLITPTDACLGFLDPDRLAKIDIHGRQLSGDKASKTMALHAAIYSKASQFDPDTSCIIHTHSSHCVTLTLEPNDAKRDEIFPELLPAITPYFVMKVGHVPTIPYASPGSVKTIEFIERAIEMYGVAGTPLRACMLSRLGPYAWNNSPSSAMATLEELEETAKIFYLKNAPIKPLTDVQLNELRTAFAVRW